MTTNLQKKVPRLLWKQTWGTLLVTTSSWPAIIMLTIRGNMVVVISIKRFKICVFLSPDKNENYHEIREKMKTIKRTGSDIVLFFFRTGDLTRRTGIFVCSLHSKWGENRAKKQGTKFLEPRIQIWDPGSNLRSRIQDPGSNLGSKFLEPRIQPWNPGSKRLEPRIQTGIQDPNSWSLGSNFRIQDPT